MTSFLPTPAEPLQECTENADKTLDTNRAFKQQYIKQCISSTYSDSNAMSVQTSLSKEDPPNFSTNRQIRDSESHRPHEDNQWDSGISSETESCVMSVRTTQSKEDMINFSENRSHSPLKTTQKSVRYDDSDIWTESEYESYSDSAPSSKNNLRRQNNKERKDNFPKKFLKNVHEETRKIRDEEEQEQKRKKMEEEMSDKINRLQKEIDDNKAAQKNNIVFFGMLSLLAVFVAVAVKVFVPFIISSAFRGPEVNPHELRVMLVGKTGAGKGASGNTILGEDAFRVEASPSTVTAHCDRRNKVVFGQNITVIDTPGLMDTWLALGLTEPSKPECILDPALRPHVFLLVIRLRRFTEEEMNAVKWIQENFGEEALQFTIILFTGGDQLEGKPIKKFISNSVELQGIVDTYGRRYHVFNNNQKNNRVQVQVLFKKINEMLFQSLGYIHTQDVHQRAQRITREEEKRKKHLEIKEIKAKESSVRAEMERQIRKEEELKRRELIRKMKEEEIKSIEKKEKWIREEEEQKCSKET